MSKKYQFRYLLPEDLDSIKKLRKQTIDKVANNFENPDGIHLNLIEGLAMCIMGVIQCNMNTKLAYEPGKRSPCYALGLCSFDMRGKKVYFPYGGEDSRKANMFMVDSPELRNIDDRDPEEFIGLFGSVFLPEHKKDRYVGPAYERACIILNLFGHMKILKLLNNIMGFGVYEYFDWVFRAAGTTQEQYYNELNAVAKLLTVEKNIDPFFEIEDGD